MEIELEITENGGLGDGIGHYDGKAVYVPLSVRGDVVRAEVTRNAKDHLRAALLEVVTPSKYRKVPPCTHYGTCGGCSLQHMDASIYTQIKQNMVLRLVKQLGVADTVVKPMIHVGAHSRRRAEFKVAVNKGDVRLGFMAAHSHEVVAIESCYVSVPAINEVLSSLKACLQAMKKPSRVKAISITALDTGLDVLVSITKGFHAQDKAALAAFVRTAPIIRLTLQDEEHMLHILHDVETAEIAFGGAAVQLPVGAFLQASDAGQVAITDYVTQSLQDCSHVADIYAGCGTYSFPLVAKNICVSAYEGASDMVAAMHNAILQSALDDRMSATMRDLFASPLSASELRHYDGVVINPPRNGALPQVKKIAGSGVRNVVMVSCNPATFMRDAKVLLEAGYIMQSITAIDQFYMSSHLEVVACFTKTHTQTPI